MDAPVPLILVALLAAAALVAPTARSRAATMLAALAIAPVILVFHISGSDQFRALTDRPSLAVAAGAAAVVLVLALAWAIHRWPSLLPVLAVAAVPFRVPIALGGTTANLLVPLYGVVAAGVLAYALPRLKASESEAPRARGGRARVGARRVRRAVRDPGVVLDRLRPRARERRVLLRAVRAAVRAREPDRVDAAPDGGVPRGARRARARVRRDRLRRVRDAPPVPQPEGDRLQPAAGLLPGQLALLRPEHLRALPRDRDAARRRVAAVGPARARRRRGRDRAGGALGRARPHAVAVELRGAARRAHGARRHAVEREEGDRAGGGVPRARGGVRARGAERGAARPRELEVGELGDERALRPDLGRRGPVRRPAGAGVGHGLVPAPVPPRRARVGRARDVGLAHDPDHRRGRAGRDRARGVRGAARSARCGACCAARPRCRRARASRRRSSRCSRTR